MNTSNVRPAAVEAWKELTAAMQHSEPACTGEPRYIADKLTGEDRFELSKICAECPLIDLCAKYSATEAPRGGWWPSNLIIQPCERLESSNGTLAKS
ncbi:MAG: hypothetical protein ACTHZ9_03350 [Leucobacter sp.]